MSALPPPAEPLVHAAGLAVTFGDDRVLDGIDLDVPRGVVLGLIGPSGSGKTTLIRALCGIVGPSGGDLTVYGIEPRSFRTGDRRRFGYMPQKPVLIPTLSLWDNLHFVASMYGLRVRGRKRRFRELLDLVDLWPHRDKLLSESSGGMQRRLMLAATLVHDPELVFLDEPTAGIDPILRDRFWDRFRHLRDEGHTLVVSTQYVGEAAMCDLVAVIADGRLLRVDTPEGLRRGVLGGDLVDVRLANSWLTREQYDRLRALDGVRSIHRTDDGLRFVVDDHTTAVPMLVERTRAEGLDVAGVEPVVVPYDDVFIALVRKAQAEREAATAAHGKDAA